MREREPSELEIGAAFRAFLEDAPTEVRPTELADQLARAHPRRRAWIGGWRSDPMASIAWFLLAVALLLALVVGGLIAGARRPAVVSTTGTVSITIDGLAGAEGQQMAAIIHDVGGFKIAIDADPFTATETIRSGSPLLSPSGSPPIPPGDEYWLAEVAQVPAGTFPLRIWVAEELGIWNEWLPGGPMSMYCDMRVTVVEGQRTEIRVTGVTPATDDGTVPPDHIDTTCETD